MSRVLTIQTVPYRAKFHKVLLYRTVPSSKVLFEYCTVFSLKHERVMYTVPSLYLLRFQHMLMLNHHHPHPHHTNSKLHDREEIEQYYENKSYQSILGDPKTVFEPYPNPKNSPLGPQKVKNEPKIKSKSNVKIEGNIENESCSTT